MSPPTRSIRLGRTLYVPSRKPPLAYRPTDMARGETSVSEYDALLNTAYEREQLCVERDALNAKVAHLEAELEQARKTQRRLHRRVQLAESALYEVVHGTGMGVSFGRKVLAWHAAKLQHEIETLKRKEKP